MMECPFCEHPQVHKHSKTSKGQRRDHCPSCYQTFTDTLDTLESTPVLNPASAASEHLSAPAFLSVA